MNLELQKKIDDAIKEVFVGNYIFSEEEQTEMLRYTKLVEFLRQIGMKKQEQCL